MLRFFAYFLETIPVYGHNEQVLRKCAICFYLEDGTLQVGPCGTSGPTTLPRVAWPQPTARRRRPQVSEPKAANSGIVQGTFLKRHRVASPSSPGKFVGVSDLAVGGAVTLYGHAPRRPALRAALPMLSSELATAVACRSEAWLHHSGQAPVPHRGVRPLHPRVPGAGGHSGRGGRAVPRDGAGSAQESRRV